MMAYKEWREDRFAKLQGSSKYPLLLEANKQPSEKVLRVAGGVLGDVVGANGTMRLYACFDKHGEVMWPKAACPS